MLTDSRTLPGTHSRRTDLPSKTSRRKAVTYAFFEDRAWLPPAKERQKYQPVLAPNQARSLGSTTGLFDWICYTTGSLRLGRIYYRHRRLYHTGYTRPAPPLQLKQVF